MTHTVDDPFADDPEFVLPDGPSHTNTRGSWGVVRELKVPDDLHLLTTRVPAPRQTLTQIRHTHHQLARLIATGTPIAECSLITGYQPSYISTLKGDPSFRELLDYYSSQREQIFIDVVERMRTLGLASIDELQSRLETEPDEFSRRELMELTELMLVKPQAARTQMNPAGGVGKVAVNVKFVTARTEDSEESSVRPLVIEHDPTN